MLILSLDPPKLYLNEQLSPVIAVQLRNQGFDVTSSQEAGMLAETDRRETIGIRRF